MLPSSLLTTSHGHQILVELKNGETYNGHLINSDSRMNLNLRGVFCTSREGDRFWKIPHIYVRGQTVKYLRLEEEVLSKVKEESIDQKRDKGRGRGRGRLGLGSDRERESKPAAAAGRGANRPENKGRGTEPARGRGRGKDARGGRGRGDRGRGRK